MDIIRSMDLYRVRLPLKQALHHARTDTSFLDQVLLVITTGDGTRGYGEVRGNGGYATGASAESIIAAFRDGGRALLGASLGDAAQTMLQGSGSPLAAALVEAATLDAAGRRDGVPVWRLLGGSGPRRLETHAAIGFVGPDRAAEIVREAAGKGIRRFKVRVGSETIADDVERVAAVREAAGADAEIGIDANGAWSVERSRESARLLGPYGVAWVEQPTPVGDDEALKAVRRLGAWPVLADEGVRTYQHVRHIIENGLADGVNLKIEKSGTVATLRRAVEAAREGGLLIELGQMDQGRLGCAFTSHLGTALDVDKLELWGFQNVTDDVATGLELEDGAMVLSSEPGLGVSVDLSRAERVLSLC